MHDLTNNFYPCKNAEELNDACTLSIVTFLRDKSYFFYKCFFGNHKTTTKFINSFLKNISKMSANFGEKTAAVMLYYVF